MWTADREDTRRLLAAAPSALAGAEPVTPPGLQVRGVIAVDGDTVLFQASGEPTEIGLWAYGAGGLSRVTGPAAGVEAGARAGGTTVVSSRGLDDDGVTVRVYRDGGEVASIASLARAWRCRRRGRSCSVPGRARSARQCFSRPGTSRGSASRDRGSCRCCSTRTAARTRSAC